jgi:hypothetical protein
MVRVLPRNAIHIGGQSALDREAVDPDQALREELLEATPAIP